MLSLSLKARCTLATHSLRHSNHGRKHTLLDYYSAHGQSKHHQMSSSHRTLQVCTGHQSIPVGTRTYEAPNTFLHSCSHIQGPCNALQQTQDCIRTSLGLYTHHVRNIPRGRAFGYSLLQPIPVHIHTYVVCCILRGLSTPQLLFQFHTQESCTVRPPILGCSCTILESCTDRDCCMHLLQLSNQHISARCRFCQSIQQYTCTYPEQCMYHRGYTLLRRVAGHNHRLSIPLRMRTRLGRSKIHVHRSRRPK